MASSAPVALVTGGAIRVGRAIVNRLAAAGFDVLFTYHTSAGPAQELAKSIATMGRRGLAIRADLTDPQAATRDIAASFSAEFDRLDVLVNNVSVYEPSALKNVTLDQSRRFWAVHVEAPLLLCRTFERQLRQAQGFIVNMVDLLAERPWPDYLLYCASKAALSNLTLGLARELAPDVKVNGIAPGVVEWPDDYPQSDREQYLSRVPLGRAGTGDDVAELVHFLCTRGTYITGQILRLDGGRSIT